MILDIFIKGIVFQELMINIDNILSYPSLYPNEYNKGGNFIYIFRLVERNLKALSYGYSDWM